MKLKTKALLVDILGFSLVIIAPFLGWIPGPGGIPVLILGLSLLATNHAWAERLLNQVKEQVGKAAQKVNNTSPAAKWAIDIASVLFIAGAVIIITQVTRSLWKTASISLIIVGITLLITNQNRYQKIWNKYKAKHKQ